MKAAVIGAGWAGLSAAFELHRQGHDVTVFESAHRLGGRARAVQSPKLASTLDNGQHIMLSAYNETLTLMQELGLSCEQRLFRMPLALESADGSFSLRVPNLPDAFALPVALLRARGLSWPERLRLVRLLAGLRMSGWRTAPGLTVASWLKQGRQSEHIVRLFWEPLCLAALNTPLQLACAQLFTNVLRDSLGAGAGASQVLISRVDLSTLWPDKLPTGVRVLKGHTVRDIALARRPEEDSDSSSSPGSGSHLVSDSHNGSGAASAQVLVDGNAFDAAIIATNVWPAHRLLQQLPARSVKQQAYLKQFDSFTPIPIATLTLQLAERWKLPHPMLMLRNAPEQGRYGQWLFHCNEFLDEPLQASRLNVVISDAGNLQGLGADQVAQAVIAQITEETDGYPTMPAVKAYELITEKRATFAAVPGLQRPDNATVWPGIYVAGDWTDTGYPAVLEGAVRSGRRAARLLMNNG